MFISCENILKHPDYRTFSSDWTTDQHYQDLYLVLLNCKIINNSPGFKPNVHQLWLPSIQILAHLKQLFVAIQIKQIRSNLQGHPLHRCILSHKFNPLGQARSKALHISKNTLFYQLMGIGIKGGVYFMGNWILFNTEIYFCN